MSNKKITIKSPAASVKKAKEELTGLTADVVIVDEVEDTEIDEAPEVIEAPVEAVMETPDVEAPVSKLLPSGKMPRAFGFKKKFPNPTPEVQAPRQRNLLLPSGKTHRLTKPNVQGVHANPAFLTFPTDKWSLTKDLRAALIQVASRIGGQEDKKALVDETLRICLGHLEAKFTEDKRQRDARIAAANV